VTEENGWHTLAARTVLSEPGNEHPVMDRVAAVVEDFPLPAQRLERLTSAVSEATLNAIEHGNQYRAELPVSIAVLTAPHGPGRAHCRSGREPALQRLELVAVERCHRQLPAAGQWARYGPNAPG
jgi:Histidine kinase-like ATPase domain